MADVLKKGKIEDLESRMKQILAMNDETSSSKKFATVKPVLANCDDTQVNHIDQLKKYAVLSFWRFEAI